MMGVAPCSARYRSGPSGVIRYDQTPKRFYVAPMHYCSAFWQVALSAANHRVNALAPMSSTLRQPAFLSVAPFPHLDSTILHAITTFTKATVTKTTAIASRPNAEVATDQC